MAKPPSDNLLSSREGLTIERSLRRLGEGLLGLDQRLAVSGVSERTLVTSGWWVFAYVRIEAGSVTALSRTTSLPLGREFAMFVPARSLLRLRFTDARLVALGLAGAIPPPSELPAVPQLASWPTPAVPPSGLDDLRAALAQATLIDPDAGVPPLAQRTRRVLYDHLDSRSPLRDIATRLRAVAAVTSRAFSGGYGMSLKEYTHRARIADGVLALLAGQAIGDAAGQVGFADLSRFYAQFRRITGNTPAQYRALMSKKR